MTTVLTEGARLHAMGFAVHWLEPNSKRPIEKKWTTGPRIAWPKLEAFYRRRGEALNLGVRLGEASRFPDGTFLAVIDCDMKSSNPKHREEMTAALDRLIKYRNSPMVASGRGNGSRHIYVRVKAANRGYRFTQSGEKVSVKILGSKPTPFDRRNLNDAELEQGYRMRAAWEISVMGEGQQVVLPPSVHPDTGKLYSWGVPLTDWQEIPILKTEAIAPAIVDERPDFEVTGVWDDVDLIGSKLSDRVVGMIVKGEGVDDRSAALFAVSAAMHRCGFTDNEILSVLTDRENFLGATAFEHAQTKSRSHAAKWLMRYTLDKVKREASAQVAFEREVEYAELTDEAAAKQAEKLKGDWETRLERAGNGEDARPKGTLKNIHLILTNAVGPGVFTRNEFTHVDFYGMNTPWGGMKGSEINEQDLINIKFWIAGRYRFEPAKEAVLEAVLKIADENRYHPVREYLGRLKWDGVSRLDNWLVEYMGATGPKEYLRAVGRKTLCAMVKRVLEPGCKFDHVLILEGPQGCGKSTAVRLLSEPWFSDAHITIGDKDAVLAMRMAWVLEIGEMSSMRKADLDQLKQFISQSVDRIRVPYGRLTEAFPRQSIFIGTTNSSEYLKDTTGNRRFWPVTVSQCRFNALAHDRDQLLAEAKVALDLGEELWLDEKAVAKTALEEQGARVFTDEWVEMLGKFLRNRPEGFPPGEFTVGDLFADFGPLAHWKCTRQEQMRAGDCLRLAGFEKRRTRVRGQNANIWVKKGE